MKSSKQKCRFNFGLDENFENVLYSDLHQQCCDEKDYQYIKPKHENNGMCYGEKGVANRKSDFAKVKKNVLSRYKDNPKNKFSIQNDPNKNDYYEWIAKNYNKLEKNQNVLDDLYLLSQSRYKSGSKYPVKDDNDVTTMVDFDNLYYKELPAEQQKVEIFKIKLNDLLKKRETSDPSLQTIPYIKLYSGIYGELVVPLQEQSSCALGSGTQWCTAAKSNNMFSHYNKDGPLFIWKDQRIPKHNKFQFHFETFSFMNDEDEPIKSDYCRMFLEVPVLNELFTFMLEKSNIVVRYAAKFLDILSKDVFDEAFSDLLQHVYNNEYEMDCYKVYMIRKQDNLLESKLLRKKDNELSIDYAIYSLGKRWPELEEQIIMDENYGIGVDYAEKVIKGRWPELEDELMKPDNFYYSIKYAEKIIKGRWSELEEQLIKNRLFHFSLDYAEKIIKGRWVELEDKIIMGRDYDTGVEYAETVIEGRWPELEDKIIMDEKYNTGVDYAEIVIKGRWSELEDILIKSKKFKRVIKYAISYAEKVIKGRWSELEDKILDIEGDLRYGRIYAKKVIEGRWPELEKQIIMAGDNDTGFKYAEKIIKGRWPELEEEIIMSGDHNTGVKYAEKVIKGRWSELEKQLFAIYGEYEQGDIDIDELVELKKYFKNVANGNWPELQQKLLNSSNSDELMEYFTN